MVDVDGTWQGIGVGELHCDEPYIVGSALWLPVRTAALQKLDGGVFLDNAAVVSDMEERHLCDPVDSSTRKQRGQYSDCQTIIKGTSVEQGIKERKNHYAPCGPRKQTPSYHLIHASS